MLDVSRGWTIRAGAAAAISLAGEFLAVAGAIAAAHVVYHLAAYGEQGPAALTVQFAALLAAVYSGANLMRGGHDSHLGAGRQANSGEIFLVWNTAFIIALFMLFLGKQIEAYSRGAILLSYGFGLATAIGVRHVIAGVAARATHHGLVTPRRAFVVGLSSDISAFVTAQSGGRGLSVIDAIAIPESARDGAGGDLETVLAMAVERARELEPDDIVVAVPLRDAVLVERIVDAMVNVPANLFIVRDGLLGRFRDIATGHIGDVSGLVLSRQRLTPLDQALKRGFDLAASAAALAALAPFLVAVGIAIRLESRGPALFVQTRYGFNEEPFRIIKFRTMTTQDDGSVVRQATRGDKRITRFGRFLRRSSIDELPQLINVLRGDMSLVGPRPHAVAHNRYYEQRVARYARRHNVKPGITGWAQVNGLRGETDTDEKMAQRVACDLYYLDNWSFGFDLRILALTVVTMLGGRNAY